MVARPESYKAVAVPVIFKKWKSWTAYRMVADFDIARICRVRCGDYPCGAR